MEFFLRHLRVPFFKMKKLLNIKKTIKKGAAGIL
jgi:hypothetical protein